MTTDNKSPPQHTPTPWIVGCQTIGGPGNAVMKLHQSGPYRALAICDIADDPTNEANAAFIVRACNSHHALLEALERIAQVTPETSGRVVPSIRQRDIARAAIAKANGL